MKGNKMSGQRKKKLLKGHQNHPQDAWDATIDVFLNSVGPAPNYQADFDILTCLPVDWDGSDPNPTIFFFNRGRPGFKITFRLFDNTNGGAGTNYQFANNKDDAIWSKLGDTCPTGAVHDVFAKKDVVVQSGTTLLVKNPNDNSCLGNFKYTLNVAIGGNGPYVHLDPGGQNMNGATS
jgi:hypothetical protein